MLFNLWQVGFDNGLKSVANGIHIDTTLENVLVKFRSTVCCCLADETFSHSGEGEEETQDGHTCTCTAQV